MKNDYDLKEKIKINFQGLDYYIMPRYKEHYADDGYERFSLMILKNYLNQDSTFVDIGAHYGAFALFAAKKCGSKVIALEPVDENFKILSENIKLNGVAGRAKLYNYAASDQDGEAEFNIPWASDSAGFYEHPEAETIKKQKVTVKNVDGLLNGAKVDFIKIDTEGHELSVLDGLADTIKRNPDAPILIEANPPLLISAGHTTEELLNKLANDFNKEIYVVDDNKFTLYKLSGRISDWEKYIGRYANILCLPKQDNKYALYVSPSAHFGGAELAMLNQISALRSRNIVCHVILPSPGVLVNKLIELGVGYSVVDSYTFWIKEANTRHNNRYNIESSKKMSDIAQDIACDLIINNTMVTPWGYPAAKVLKLPLLWMVHEFGDLDHGFQFSEDTQAIRKFILNSSDKIICCSQAVKDAFEAPGQPSGKLEVIYNLLDLDEITAKSMSKAANPFGGKSGAIKLIMVGRITESKGQIDAIQALSELKKDDIEAELVIVGDGPAEYKALLRKKVSQLGLNDRVKFLGYKENPYPYIKLADFLLVCSKNEAFGRMTAEAMVLGTPVIGSDSGGTREMILPGKTGFQFSAGDATELAGMIKIAYKSSNQKIISAARQRIRKVLDNKTLTDQLAKSLLQATNQPRDRSIDPIFITEWLDCVVVNMEEKADLDKTKARLEAEKNELQKQFNSLSDDYQNILNSKSWVLTKPLRQTRKIVRRNRRR